MLYIVYIKALPPSVCSMMQSVKLNNGHCPHPAHRGREGRRERKKEEREREDREERERVE